MSRPRSAPHGLESQSWTCWQSRATRCCERDGRGGCFHASACGMVLCISVEDVLQCRAWLAHKQPSHVLLSFCCAKAAVCLFVWLLSGSWRDCLLRSLAELLPRCAFLFCDAHGEPGAFFLTCKPAAPLQRDNANSPCRSWQGPKLREIWGAVASKGPLPQLQRSKFSTPPQENKIAKK